MRWHVQRRVFELIGGAIGRFRMLPDAVNLEEADGHVALEHVIFLLCAGTETDRGL